MNFKAKCIPALILLTLSGCASQKAFIESEDAKNAKVNNKIGSELAKVDQAMKRSSTLVKAKGSWLGGKSMPLSVDPDLPEVFKQSWSFSFPGRLDLATVAERVTKITGVPVRLSPDVYLTRDKLMQGGATVALAPAAPGAVDATGQFTASLSSATALSDKVVTPNREDMAINYSGTLEGFLNLVSAQTNTDWEYKNGKVDFFRLVTKSFTIKSAPGKSAFTASVGKTGITTGGSGSGASGTSSFSSDGNSKMISEYSVWPAIEDSIKTMLSPAGKFSVNQATGTVTVTDSKKIVGLVEDHIRRENAIMTRQVRLRVEFLSVALSKEHESGVDWNVVYTRLSSALDPRFNISLGTPTSLTSAQAGGMSFNITASGGNGTWDRLNGSTAMIKALSAYGKASVVTTTSAMTLNRQPVPVTLTEQVGYLAATTPASSAGISGSSAPGLTPGLVTTGYVLNMLPTVMDTGNILLQFAIDISELKKINTVTSGSGINQQTIQTPEVSATQILQRASIKSGETLVLAGFDREDGQYDKRSLTEEHSNLSGTTTGRAKRTASVIMITPIVEDGE